jgi:DNA-binding NtrC family response regulator
MAEPKQHRILIVDDEPLYLRTTAELLRKAGYECVCADTGDAALAELSTVRIDLILSDLNMPGNFKLELLKEGRKQWPDIPLIVVTGAPSLPTAIESVRLGIADYLLKPVKLDDLLASVQRALTHRIRPIDDALGSSTASDRSRLPGVVGDSLPMRELSEIVSRIADTDTNVLITGESGTGKEVVAHAIHQQSRRSTGTFQTIDCTAIPETLFESILFGHARGAFTGAVSDQAGLLKGADRGTAFFDEIGELPATLQSKLLRVIQEQTFIPVGKTAPVTVDTRFICATNRDLELEVAAGRFRRDLYYRLAVVHIELPPLRDRGDDVILLAKHFLDLLAGNGQRAKRLSTATVDLIRQYHWPGNIRELRNAIERGIAMARGDVVHPEDLPPTLHAVRLQSPLENKSSPATVTHADALDGAEREFLVSLLEKHSGNVAQSAREAGLSRQGFHKLIRRHGLDAEKFRQ